MRKLVTDLAWWVLERWWDDWRWTVYVNGSVAGELLEKGRDPRAVRQHAGSVVELECSHHPGARVYAERTVVGRPSEVVWGRQ